MKEIGQLQEQVQQMQGQLQQLRRENTLLRQKLDALARRFFGKKSEQLNPAQLELLLSGLSDQLLGSEEDSEPDPPAKPKSRSKRSGNHAVRVPEDLEVVQEVIEPELVMAQPQAWKQITQEVSRRLDYEPGKFFWREIVRPKYVRKGQPHFPPVVAPAPAQVIEHGLATAGLLAQILLGKFAEHLPYYRQQQIYWQRHGVWITRQQMVHWTHGCVRLLSGITDCLERQMRQKGYVQVDETPIKYQDVDLPGRCAQGYLWTALVPGQLVIFQWHPSRAAKCLNALLGEGFEGKLQCDAYSAYPAFAQDKHAVQLFGCWSHTRRNFFQAHDQDPKIAGWVLNHIGSLYQWERQLRESRAGPGLRSVIRCQNSQMVIQRLHRALLKLKPKYLPQSPMGKAISYALNHWSLLKGYVDNGEVEIDTNLVENAIRPTAVGKKNWLFIGAKDAGQRTAVIYTLIENCRMHGINPYAYLKDVLERLPNTTNHGLEELTPLHWQKARNISAVKAA